MCKFFSLVSDGKGTIYYFDWKQRQQILAKKLKDRSGNVYMPDSHSSIIEFVKIQRNYLKHDFDTKFNTYEYNPLTKEFFIDTINVKDDSERVRKKCESLDFSTIVEPLILKKIVHPFRDIETKKVHKKDIKLLKKWASVRGSVNDFVWGSIRDSIWGSIWGSVNDSISSSVRDSIWGSIRASIWGSIWGSVWDSICSSVRDSICSSIKASVRSSVWDSVSDAVRAYISSFFKD